MNSVKIVVREIDRVNPYLSIIQTNGSGLIHILTEIQIFRDNVFAKCSFLYKPLPDSNPYVPFRFDAVCKAQLRVQRKCVPERLICFMNPHRSTIQT